MRKTFTGSSIARMSILLLAGIMLLFTACGKSNEKSEEAENQPSEMTAGLPKGGTSGKMGMQSSDIDADLAVRLKRIFSDRQIADMAAYRKSLQAISDPATFTAAYELAVRLSDDLSETLRVYNDKKYEQAAAGQEYDEPDINEYDWIVPAIPGFECIFYGEGTVPALEVDRQYFKKRASGTCPAFADHHDLLMLCYDGNTTGWPKWNVRNWDYGGANSLGNGTHLAILAAIDSILAKDMVFDKETVLKIRTEVLKNIVEGDDHFGYYDPEGQASDEQWLAKIHQEIDRIMQNIDLSDEEKALLQERKAKPFPREVKKQ